MRSRHLAVSTVAILAAVLTACSTPAARPTPSLSASPSPPGCGGPSQARCPEADYERLLELAATRHLLNLPGADELARLLADRIEGLRPNEYWSGSEAEDLHNSHLLIGTLNAVLGPQWLPSGYREHFASVASAAVTRVERGPEAPNSLALLHSAHRLASAVGDTGITKRIREAARQRCAPWQTGSEHILALATGVELFRDTGISCAFPKNKLAKFAADARLKQGEMDLRNAFTLDATTRLAAAGVDSPDLPVAQELLVDVVGPQRSWTIPPMTEPLILRLVAEAAKRRGVVPTQPERIAEVIDGLLTTVAPS